MKKINYLLASACMLLALAQHSFAQKDSSGIYKTAGDFQQKKLSYAINYKTEKHTISDDMFFDEKDVKVKHAGVKYTLQKSNTYGYRNMQGEDFRFMDDKAYKILNPNYVVPIYTYLPPNNPGKGANRNKNLQQYYFSLNATSPLQELTKANLKAAYPSNHKLHDALDAQFKDDTGLYAYDNFHKMYKLNWVIKNNLD